MPVFEAEQVVGKLTERGAPVKYLLHPNEGHDFTRVNTRVQVTNMIVAMFEEYLF